MKEHSVHARHLTGDWSHHHTCWTTIDNHARVTAPPVAACRHAAGGSGPILPRGGYVIPHSSRVRSKLLFPGLGVAQLGPNTKKRLPATATAAVAVLAAPITTTARSEQLTLPAAAYVSTDWATQQKLVFQGATKAECNGAIQYL